MGRLMRRYLHVLIVAACACIPLASSARAGEFGGPPSQTGVISGTSVVSSPANPNPIGPCDIIAAAGQNCVAAHSVARRLFGAYTGPLFQLERTSDSTTANIGSLASGLYNAAAVASFCLGTDCLVSELFDQTINANHLLVYTANMAAWNIDHRNGLPVLNNVNNMSSYDNSNRTGVNIPTGAAPKTLYYVRAADWYGTCCGDYGLAENPVATNCPTQTNCPSGAMFSLAYENNYNPGFYTANPSQLGVGLDTERWLPTGPLAFYPIILSAFGKYDGANVELVEVGDATKGTLRVLFQTVPYVNPPITENGIVLGSGGDATFEATEFFEGAIVAGETTLATDQAVQANVVGFYGPLLVDTIVPYSDFQQGGVVSGTARQTDTQLNGGLYGLRRLRLSYTGYAALIERASDLTTQNVGFSPTGDFDDASAQAFCAATTCSVNTLYNQSIEYRSNIAHNPTVALSQPVGADQPLLTFANLSGRTTMHFNGSQNLCTAAPDVALTPLWAIMAVARRTGAYTTAAAVVGNNQSYSQYLGFSAIASTATIVSNTASATAPLTDGTWGLLVGNNLNGSVSVAVNNGIPGTGSGTTEQFAQKLCIGGSGTGGSTPLTGDVAEVAILGTTPTTAQAVSYYNDVHAYYGGAF
jgi:hypothetical protein